MKSKTVLFNTTVGIFALLETQTQVFASVFGPECLPFIGLGVTAVNIYLRSITTEALEDKK